MGGSAPSCASDTQLQGGAVMKPGSLTGPHGATISGKTTLSTYSANLVIDWKMSPSASTISDQKVPIEQ